MFRVGELLSVGSVPTPATILGQSTDAALWSKSACFSARALALGSPLPIGLRLFRNNRMRAIATRFYWMERWCIGQVGEAAYRCDPSRLSDGYHTLQVIAELDHVVLWRLSDEGVSCGSTGKINWNRPHKERKNRSACGHRYPLQNCQHGLNGVWPVPP